MSFALLFHYLLLNMFRMLVHPSSGACDLFVELFHELYCSGSMCDGVTVCFGLGGVVSLCRLKQSKWNNKASNIKLVYLYSTMLLSISSLPAIKDAIEWQKMNAVKRFINFINNNYIDVNTHSCPHSRPPLPTPHAYSAKDVDFVIFSCM